MFTSYFQAMSNSANNFPEGVAGEEVLKSFPVALDPSINPLVTFSQVGKVLTASEAFEAPFGSLANGNVEVRR